MIAADLCRTSSCGESFPCVLGCARTKFFLSSFSASIDKSRMRTTTKLLEARRPAWSRLAFAACPLKIDAKTVMPCHPARFSCALLAFAHPWTRPQDVLGSFGCEAVTAAAEQLREIVNLYVVPPENLTSLMEQGMLAEMESEVCVYQ